MSEILIGYVSSEGVAQNIVYKCQNMSLADAENCVKKFGALPNLAFYGLYWCPSGIVTYHPSSLGSLPCPSF